MSVLRELFTTRVNATMMSINERFTYLQKNICPAQPNVMLIRAKNAAQQQASSKNRRLAMQMERRLTAMAALKIKKKSIRQRLGIPAGNLRRGNVRDRLSLPVGVRGRGRPRGQLKRNRGPGLRRSQSRQSLQGGNLQRSRSLQSLNEIPKQRGRSRSRSRSKAGARVGALARGPRSGSAVGRSNSVIRLQGPGKRYGGGKFQQRQAGPFQQRKRNNSVGPVNRNQRNQINRRRRNQNFGGNRGRNTGGGRQQRQKSGTPIQGRRRNSVLRKGQRGRGNNQVTKNMPSKEELDQQLDQYMANTKSHLDRELDTYMKESNEGEIF